MNTTNINIPTPTYPNTNFFNGNNPLANTLLNAVQPNYNNLTEAQQLVNSGITAQSFKELQTKCDTLMKELNMKKEAEAICLEKELIKTEEGKLLMDVKDKQIMRIFIEQALLNPAISGRIKAILEKYEEEANKIINNTKNQEVIKEQVEAQVKDKIEAYKAEESSKVVKQPLTTLVNKTI